jgi:uncharacterized protein
LSFIVVNATIAVEMTTNDSRGTFDQIAEHRPALAAGCLAMLDAQPGRPLAMFAPRRVGKTWFLDHDLAPAARAAGRLPVYADLWLQKAAPLEAINHALAEALDDVPVPAGGLGRLARTPVKKRGCAGRHASQLADAPSRRAAARRTRVAARRAGAAPGVHAAAARPLLLMLDEVQALADGVHGRPHHRRLRAVLHKRRDILQSVFTGSSQEAMARLLSTAGSPMYQFAQLMDFPVLGDDYLQGWPTTSHTRAPRPSSLPMDDAAARLRPHRPQARR